MPPTVEHRRGCHGGAVQRGGSQKLKNCLFNLPRKKQKKSETMLGKCFMVIVYYSQKSSNEIDF